MTKALFKLVSMNIQGEASIGRIYGPLGDFVCWSVEREWLNNEPSISCIPGGLYDMPFLESPSKGLCIHLVNENASVTAVGPSVRTHCLFHSANHASELEGCIAPGLKLNNSWGVSDSVKALDKLEMLVMMWANYTTAEKVQLEIIRNI